jgi:hypothetical protein
MQGNAEQCRTCRTVEIKGKKKPMRGSKPQNVISDKMISVYYALIAATNEITAKKTSAE